VSRRVLLSPRASTAPDWGDQGERVAFIGRQRVGRAVRPARRSRRRLLWRRAALGLATAVLGGGVLAGGWHWLLTSPRFAVSAVQVRGASRVAPEHILGAAAIVPGTSLWRVDPHEVAARVEALPGVRRAEVVREVPNRVVIVVEERRPFTLVSSGRLHWLDEEGRVLGEEPRAVAPPVPVITGLSEEEMASLRTAPSARVRQALALIRMLLRNGSGLVAEISEVDVSRRDGPVLYTVDGIEVRLGAEEWEERLTRLEGVLAQVAGQPVRAIDLRFRDQVVLQKGGAG
jgi:cell division protein FtsQ